MTAVTIQNLNDAASDCNTIAAIATSPLPSIVDRLGNVKTTVSGAISDIAAFNNRSTWVPGTSYLVKDVALQGGTWYLCILPHTSSSAFSADVDIYWRVWQGITSVDFLPVEENVSNLQLGINDDDALQQIASDLSSGISVVGCVFGDSTMFGADPANLAVAVAFPPPAQLQTFVNDFFGNTAFTVVNAAISGTTSAQMLAGTDGSGQTFAARVVASTARVAYCNHGANDAFGPNAISATSYRQNLIAIVRIIRNANKTPVLITPHPCMTIGVFGSQERADSTARFAQVMRDVARQHGVTLVDNNQWFGMTLMQSGVLPLAMFPDGVHGTQATYIAAGSNLADAILGGQIKTFTHSDQSVAVYGAMARCTGQFINQSTASRFSSSMTTGVSAGQEMRVIFRIGDTGLDLAVLHPIWPSGSDTLSMTIDGEPTAGISQFSMYAPGYSDMYIQDFETRVARAISPGFHILSITSAAGGAIGLNALRTRKSDRPLLLSNAGSSPAFRVPLFPKLEMASVSGNTLSFFDGMPVSRYLEPFEIEWTGQLQKDSGICIGATIGSNVSAASVQQVQVFGLQGSGFAAISEATGTATYTTTAVGSTDLSGASHLYRIAITSERFGTASYFVDDALVGVVNLTLPYYGGTIGIWKNQAGGKLTVTDLSIIYRS